MTGGVGGVANLSKRSSNLSWSMIILQGNMYISLIQLHVLCSIDLQSLLMQKSRMLNLLGYADGMVHKYWDY